MKRYIIVSDTKEYGKGNKSHDTYDTIQEVIEVLNEDFGNFIRRSVIDSQALDPEKEVIVNITMGIDEDEYDKNPELTCHWEINENGELTLFASSCENCRWDQCSVLPRTLYIERIK